MAVCDACGAAAALQWNRRPTAAELVSIDATEQAWRTAHTPDPVNPPDFGPMPDATNTTVPVYGCAQHSVSADLAVRVHQSTCDGPRSPALPTCDCTPEPAPTPVNNPLVQH
jgi:hypothetical protein